MSIKALMACVGAIWRDTDGEAFRYGSCIHELFIPLGRRAVPATGTQVTTQALCPPP